ncbi:MAG: hypothetical protein CBD18_03420 [Opitutales bacterium TMED158]|nr:MAG: hypothetical protein CBD18_03420 [Opitutales bacterium TMED158]
MKLSREKVQPKAGSSFARLDFELPEFDTHYHYHPEVEITWILESEGQRLVGDGLENFEANDLVLIGSGVPHQYRNWNRGKARSKVIQFRHDLFGATLWELPEFAKIADLFDRASRGLSFSSQASRQARRQMERVFGASEGPVPLIELLGLLTLLSRDEAARPIASAVYSQPVKAKKIDRLERVLNFLETRWREKVSLAEAAEAAALHPQSMSRFFRQHLGMTFQDYLAQLRVRRAAQLLLGSDRTVVDIAFHCGFNNLANFNRRFQRVFRQTPSSYRARD